MKPVDTWLNEYSQSHRNPVNRKLHFICIPLIVFSIVCALLALPVGDAWINAATLVIAAASAYYLMLSWRLAIGAVAVLVLMYCGALLMRAHSHAALPVVAGAIFVIGWIGQFIGHMIEGVRPSFFKDIQFLLIGPLWELAQIYRHVGLPVSRPAPGIQR